MTSTPGLPIRPEKTHERVDLLAPALVVSIIIAIFAVVTQLLNATGAASLSTTQILTTWLVSVGLIVLLWIAYIVSSAYLDARAEHANAEQQNIRAEQAAKDAEKAAKDAEQQRARAEEAEAKAEDQRSRAEEAEAKAEEQKTRAEQAAKDAEEARTQAEKAERRVTEALKDGEDLTKGYDIPRIDGIAEEDKDAWVPPHELRSLIGRERSVSTEEVFPEGCYLEPDSITLVVDETAGQQWYECLVVDRNTELEDRPHETLVRVLASQTPPPWSIPRFDLVEFEGLTITPYVSDRSPMRIQYSLRATRIRPAVTTAGRIPAPWTAPES